MSDSHNVKIWPEHFKSVVTGVKPWEIRKSDRDYKVMDTIHLHEFRPEVMNANKYTGECVSRRITHIVHGPAPGLEKGYCIMTLGPL